MAATKTSSLPTSGTGGCRARSPRLRRLSRGPRRGDPPSDAQRDAAIAEQFDCALRRPPSAAELARYRPSSTSLLRSAARSRAATGARGGLLESTSSTGSSSGRLTRRARPRAPHRAGGRLRDLLRARRPPTRRRLLAAAADGRLKSPADYAREVGRLLADERYYRGQIDPSLNGKHYRSNVTSHPKLVRFFREFFGYPGATKVFGSAAERRDLSEPGRGTVGTPGAGSSRPTASSPGSSRQTATSSARC